MAKYLVIVDSPAKVKTIFGKKLRSDCVERACQGPAEESDGD